MSIPDATFGETTPLGAILDLRDACNLARMNNADCSHIHVPRKSFWLAVRFAEKCFAEGSAPRLFDRSVPFVVVNGMVVYPEADKRFGPRRKG